MYTTYYVALLSPVVRMREAGQQFGIDPKRLLWLSKLQTRRVAAFQALFGGLGLKT